MIYQTRRMLDDDRIRFAIVVGLLLALLLPFS